MQIMIKKTPVIIAAITISLSDLTSLSLRLGLSQWEILSFYFSTSLNIQDHICNNQSFQKKSLRIIY